MSLETVSNSDFIICLGSLISKENEEIKDLIVESIAKNDSIFAYMHPMEDEDIKLFCSQFIKYEVGSEEGVLSLLLEQFLNGSENPVKDYLNDLDIGYISAESSVGEEEIEELYTNSLNANSKLLIVGDDIFYHKRCENIFKMIKLLKDFAGFEVICTSKEKCLDLDNQNFDLEEVEELNSYNGTVLHMINTDLLETGFIYGSSSFARIAKIADGEKIKIEYKGESIPKEFQIDKDMQGNIALCNQELLTSSLLDGYRYKQVKIKKVES